MGLEYRGYDSIGEAVVVEGKLIVKKDVGSFEEVDRKLNLSHPGANFGIGHTRGSTHGGVTRKNAHPHTDCDNLIAVAHNGIIENSNELKKELEGDHEFRSETDTEVIPHLIEDFVKKGESFGDSFSKTLEKIKGSYAIVAISEAENGKVFAARNESPLVLGCGKGANFLASDFPAFLPLTNQVVFLNDGEVATISPSSYKISNLDGRQVQRFPEIVIWNMEQATKEGYSHFMLKEIHEQPRVLKESLRQDDRTVKEFAEILNDSDYCMLVAEGTSNFAGISAKYQMSLLAEKIVENINASEFVPTIRNSL